MGSRFKGGMANARMARWARTGPHNIAYNLQPQEVSFEKGESVRIKKNKEVAVVRSKTSYGYELEGKKGFFLWSDLEKV
jgi:hypothetical protein